MQQSILKERGGGTGGNAIIIFIFRYNEDGDDRRCRPHRPSMPTSSSSVIIVAVGVDANRRRHPSILPSSSLSSPSFLPVDVAMSLIKY